MQLAKPAPDTMMVPLRRLLRPLVRLLIRCGVTFPIAADILGTVYVDLATEELGPSNRSDSRVSLLTGVHRKEIRRQRSLLPDEPPPPLVTRNGMLIAVWLGSPGYTDAAGLPRPLPRAAEHAPSFEHLVTSVTRDVRPRAVLDDWLSQGIVSIDAEDRVCLSVAAFLPQPGLEEQLFYFSRNLHDHIAAAVANVLAPDTAPFMDRSVHYDRLTPAAAVALEKLGRVVAQRALLEVNRQAMILAAEEAPAGIVTRRVNFGVYLYAEDEPSILDGRDLDRPGIGDEPPA